MCTCYVCRMRVGGNLFSLEVARHHATHYLSNEIREYSQWFRGADNNLADALSRDNDSTDEELTQILHLHCPSQLPQHFEIVPSNQPARPFGENF